MPVNEFLGFLQRETGPALRVVTWYSADAYGGIYIREDLSRDAVIERVEFLSEGLMSDSDLDKETPLDDLGEEKAMVQVREDVVILRFPIDHQRGLVVSLDVEVASDLHGFVLECSQKLEGASISFRSSAVQ